MKIELSFGWEEPFETVEISKGTTIEKLYKENIDKIKYNKFGALVDNEVKPLTYEIETESKIKLLDIKYKQAYLIYQNSLTMLLLKAAKDIIGDKSITVSMTLNEGLYLQVDSGSISDDDVAKISIRMKELIGKNLPFEEGRFTKKKAKEMLGQEGYNRKSEAFKLYSESETIRLYTLDNYSDYYYSYLVPSTSYIKDFELMKYREGILLRYAQPEDPNDIPDFVDEYIIYKAFNEQKKWNELLGVKYVADLNEKIDSGESDELILLSEALHDKKIVEIADSITKEKKRTILILGPSSSGKTTFAHRLMIQLRVNGLNPLYLGTDDYFVDRKEMKRDEKGELDFEGIDALDLDLFQKQIMDLQAGKKVDLPTFDFLKGEKIYGKRITTLADEEPIIIEGIHAFNPKLTDKIEEKTKYRIYMSPLTQINLTKHNRIPTTDTRIVRRIIRDSRTRGYGAADTLKTWGKVHDGENENIFPYSSKADVFFNSSFVFEMAVLKKHVVPLLEKIKKDEDQYPEAQRLLQLFGFVKSMDDSKLAPHSILREFIGGSAFQ